jgi:hypothetical protein
MRLRLCRRGVYASQSFILLLCTCLYVPRPERELELPLTGACLAHKNLGAETARTHNTHTRCVKSCDACFYFALRQMPHRVPIPPVAKQATRSGPAAGKIARARCTLGGSCEARGVPEASCLGAARRKKKNVITELANSPALLVQSQSVGYYSSGVSLGRPGQHPHRWCGCADQHPLSLPA